MHELSETSSTDGIVGFRWINQEGFRDEIERFEALLAERRLGGGNPWMA